ncbi:hypothetical protein DSM43518_00971 [Mycobacterium marinum]|nr:hypothetical protein DE4381_04413 [Mycobacterium marinum]RFZ14318.1 hypothetical protein DSM43518_00971 [Mycobacterium marinum]RFZ17374.1 hypothetical protein DSM43519_04312 [Mycobacterium marinum]RFZ21335.1 hypothetical protein VIMS_00588 [Mycobacterium marinum]RFZ23069.1 hypothetical protein DSM44344_03220 [Mycobacterium marinum]
MLHGQYRLDEPGHAGCGLEVTDVGLDGSQRARVAILAFDEAIGGRQRLELDRVPELGSGAVGLHVVHTLRRDIGRAQRVGDHIALGGRVRCRDAVGAPVLVDRGTAHHRQYLILVT